MSLTPADVAHIAKLARLSITEEECASFTKDLEAILSCIDALKEVDTTGVKETSQITGLQMVTREDRPLPSSSSPDDLLSRSPLPIIDHQIETPSAHG